MFGVVAKNTGCYVLGVIVPAHLLQSKDTEALESSREKMPSDDSV
jgi:hypothetical protein